MTAAWGELLRGTGVPFASAPAPASSAESWLVPVAGLLILAVIGVFVALRVRSRVHERLGSGGSGFSLEELDAMRADGELSDAQWHAARRIVMDRLGPSAAPGEVRERP